MHLVYCAWPCKFEKLRRIKSCLINFFHFLHNWTNNISNESWSVGGQAYPSRWTLALLSITAVAVIKTSQTFHYSYAELEAYSNCTTLQFIRVDWTPWSLGKPPVVWWCQEIVDLSWSLRVVIEGQAAFLPGMSFNIKSPMSRDWKTIKTDSLSEIPVLSQSNYIFGQDCITYFYKWKSTDHANSSRKQCMTNTDYQNTKVLKWV